MTDSMEENIKRINNIHYFIDVTYYTTSYLNQNKKY